MKADGWAAAWEEAGRASVLRRSQEAAPGRWAAFYDRTADVWLEIQGEPWRLGSEVVATLAADGVLAPGDRVLDLGSGPGTFAIPLARQGVEVTAVDASSRMTARLSAAVAAEELRGVDVRTADWCDLTSADRREIALAAGFPPALSPSGIERLERLASSRCVVVTGAGPDPFPFRRPIWQRLMRDPMPDVRPQLACLMGFLLATGRRPTLRQLGWPSRLDVDADRVRHFYRGYFEMLAPQHEAASIAAAVDDAIAPFVSAGRCRAEGRTGVMVTSWPVTGRRRDES